jgi:hypothetical protein
MKNLKFKRQNFGIVIFLFTIYSLLFTVLIGCGKNPVGIGANPASDASSSIGKYKTETGTTQISSNPTNIQTLSTNSLNNCSSAFTSAGVSVGGPTSSIKLNSKVFPFCAVPLAPPSGYTGPTSGPDGSSGWYKYTWSTSESNITSTGSSYVKTSPNDYYADANAVVKSMDWWTTSKGEYNVSGYAGSYDINIKNHIVGITENKIGGYYKYDGSSISNGTTYKWDWQWDFEQSIVDTDKSGKYSWYATYTLPSGSHIYSGNVEFKEDGSGDGKLYLNNSLYLTIHWNAGGKSGYYITSDGKKCDFGGC